MSLLTVVRDVCAVVGVAAPASVFAAISSNRTMFEMVACANEMAQRIAYDTRDWTELRTRHTFLGATVIDPAGNYAQDVFPLPANYKRMLLTTNVWRALSAQTPMKFIDDHDEWLQRHLLNDNTAQGEWTLFGRELHTRPGVSPGDNITFMYLDKNCVTLTGGGFGDRFQSDTDSFRLDERLLKLGMIFDWKMKKGSPYAEDMGTYQDAISSAMGRDKPAPIYIGGRPRQDMWWGIHA
jgi:hypothetical protein